MKCLFLLFAIAVSFPQVKCQATSDEINPINLDAFIKSTFSPVSIYDRDQLIGSGYQINPFFTIVDLNLVEK